MRVIVVGTTGAGKSYFGNQLSHILHCPLIDLDHLFWEENWIGAEREVFLERIHKLIEGQTSYNVGWLAQGQARFSETIPRRSSHLRQARLSSSSLAHDNIIENHHPGPKALANTT